MTTELLTVAEKQAEKAENLQAFSGIKILHIHNQVELLLDLFGRNNIFDQYTRHNISHIDKMLNMVLWIIPNETKDVMAYAEWLMLTLSIYFHDLGLLVTNDEYANRNDNPEFIRYCSSVRNGTLGIEFKEKVEQLDGDSDKFLYQEYVRTKHPERIKTWINGEMTTANTQCDAIINEINELLNHLSPMFRRDLALICESHHLDDLDDFSKYKTNQHYGDDPNESVNLHYIAIILRTADLLHITRDRTPSIQYRMINPTDPKSIVEWQKQAAVTSVQPKASQDSDGNINPDLPRNTIEVTAFFNEPDQAEAYFGLTAYLRYAEDQIKQSFKIVQEAIKTQGTRNYAFPWESIDSENIITNGFEQKQFHFTLDQSNILQLLIGHTLYNDASVVVRELIQNGIDAIKLQNQIEHDESLEQTEGNILVTWISEKRELIFCDNGTGMTVEDIENYLLKVGSSKYRTAEFIKKYPFFSSISRFGIGLLTCFMVSDQIDIITTSVAERTANFIAIRNAHGKYLLKKLHKSSIDSQIQVHGTQIKLYIRSDVDMNSLIEEAYKWIVFPECKVNFLIDSNPIISIGYSTLSAALIDYLQTVNYSVDNSNIRVIEDSIGGINIAYAQEYNKYYDEWRILCLDDYRRLSRVKTKKYLPIGTCVEGIRVEFTSPGYKDRNILAIVNITGKNNAQTNVARSAIENNAEQDNLLSKIYCLYAKSIQNEIDRYVDEKRSPVKAASMAEFLTLPFIPTDRTNGEEKKIPQNRDILFSELGNINCIIIECNGDKKLASPNSIIMLNDIHIVDSRMITEAEYLMREIPTEKSLSQLMEFLGSTLGVSDKKTVFSNYSKYNALHIQALSGKEVSTIIVNKKQRRIDLDFISLQGIWSEYDIGNVTGRNTYKIIHIPKTDFFIDGLTDNEIGISTISGVYLSSKNALVKFVQSNIYKFADNAIHNNDYLLQLFLSIVFDRSVLGAVIKDNEQDKVLAQYFEHIWDRKLQNELSDKLWSIINKQELTSILYANEYSIYNPYEWSRNPQGKEKEYE